MKSRVVPSIQSLRFLRTLLRPQLSAVETRACRPLLQSVRNHRHFHYTPKQERIETHTLSDIGEGVKEVQIIQWFVEEGAQVEEWGPLCEVQSDKAAVEITSKYTGVIKKLHFQRDAVVQVGDAMLDIEVEGDEEPTKVEEGEQQQEDNPTSVSKEEQAAEDRDTEHIEQVEAHPSEPAQPRERGKHASLATPAVRGLLREHNIIIEDVHGTGRDGRVLKEDIHKHLNSGDSARTSHAAQSPAPTSKQTETPQRLTPIQSAMFKSMTASLSIPHFLYTDSVDVKSLSTMRKRLNITRSSETPKYTLLPFIIKAVSLAMNQYPILNSRLDTTTDSKRPQLQQRSNHNIGIAMDTPAGLLVPVIKAVNAKSISSIAQEIARLSQLGLAGRLSNEDLTGGTITVSNVGAIGGEVVAPVIVEGQLAIVGIGKVKATPIFGDDGQIKRAEMMKLCWSADHRVVDGATMARAAEVVRKYLEDMGAMVVEMT